MILGNIMGSWVTDDPKVMETFLATARERYSTLEEALEPIAAAVTDLESDWKPRWKDYWTPKLATLASLRAATQAALHVFEREQSSQTAPVPLIITATSLDYKFGLFTVESKIEEAGILMTSYLEVCTSQKEQHIRQRQRVLKALQAVVHATNEAIRDGRNKLDQAPREQQKLTTPRPARKLKPEMAPVPTPDEAETRTAVQPVLRVLHGQEEGG